MAFPLHINHVWRMGKKMGTFFEEKRMKLMKALRLILAGIILIGNPSVWLGVVFSTSVRWVLPTFVAALIFDAKVAYAKKFRQADNQVIDLRNVNISDDPSDQELSNLRLFDMSFAPTSAAPISGENHDLATAIKQTLADPTDESSQNFENFVQKYPQSRWVLSVELNRGFALYRQGYFSESVDAYQKAWDAGKTETQKPAVDLADRALVELMQMNCRVGRIDTIKSLLKQMKDRHPSGNTAREYVNTQQAAWFMTNVPGRSFLCGPFALKSILKNQKSESANDSIFDKVESPETGFSLSALLKLSDQLGMNMQMAKRAPGAEVVLPAVVNWKLGHYAALVEEKNGKIRSLDPTFRSETWLSKKVLDQESSGYFLIPTGNLPVGWVAVDQAEGEKVFGKGYIGGGVGGGGPPCKPPSCSCVGVGGGPGGGGPGGGGPGGGCGTCSPQYMPQTDIDPVTAGLLLSDIPLFYTPPVGPSMQFAMHYRHYLGTAMLYSNFGPNWASIWQGYITYNYNTNGPAYNLNCSAPGGGTEAITLGSNSVFTNGLYNATQTYGAQNLPSVITCQTSDGGSQTYGLAIFGMGQATLLLTQVTDPQSNSVNLTYDSMNRIASVTDAIGQVSTFSYTDTDPYKITEITDPFGQTASFSYDSTEHLESITDLLGLTTTFNYVAPGSLSPDWVGSMTTPYGTTNFDYTNTNSFTDFFLGEIEITDPLGLKQHARFAYRQTGRGDPFSNMPSQALRPEGVSTLYWDKKAMSDAPMSPSSATEYLLGTNGNEELSYFTAAIIKPLENPRWITYQGQTGERDDNVTCSSPATISRNILSSTGSETTQVFQNVYNSFGLTTGTVDPKGREKNNTYAANNIDIVNTADGDGDVLGAATYNNQHEPLTTTDAAGQVTNYSYNGAGQITSMTAPMHETTSYNYDSNGYLLSVTPPQPGSTVTYTYDIFGRVRTKTDAVSGTITYTYDSGNRLTQASYPDGTHETYNYDKLDLQSFTDRQNRMTSYAYDADRRKIAMTDPKMQTTIYGWCACGSMTSM